MKCSAFGAFMVVLMGCGTVTNPFVHIKPDYSQLPVEAMRKVARDIEQAVQSGNRDPQIPDRDGIVVNTDLVRQSIRTRAARSEYLNAFLDTGHAMEGRDGLVYILRTKDYKKSTTSRERDRNALLIQGENADRWTLYEGVLKAGHFSPRSLSAIQEIFYQARLDAMPQGHKYEDASGAIVRKGE